MGRIVFGVVVPAVVFAVSFYLTHLLYRHFADGAKK